jgi:hypothetical protein
MMAASAKKTNAIGEAKLSPAELFGAVVALLVPVVLELVFDAVELDLLVVVLAVVELLEKMALDDRDEYEDEYDEEIEVGVEIDVLEVNDPEEDDRVDDDDETPDEAAPPVKANCSL